MNRRSFLSLIPAAIATATLDPERLLWVPGAKVISIPKPRALTRDEIYKHLYNYLSDQVWKATTEMRVQALLYGTATLSITPSGLVVHKTQPTPTKHNRDLLSINHFASTSA